MKICTKCSIEKSLNEFPNCKRYKDGKYSWCKICSCLAATKYRIENPEKYAEGRGKRKERSLEAAREYKKKNAKSIKKSYRLYYLENQEKLKERARKYGKLITDEQRKAKQEYYKKWRLTDKGKEYQRKHNEEIKEKYPHIRLAGQKVQDALRSGILIKPKNCQVCNSEKPLDGHHHDYDKPLDVIWVCRKCHMKIHKKT